jgi:hypothetical protein
VEDDMHKGTVALAVTLVSGVALAAMSACGSSSTSGGESSFEAQIQGTWLDSVCFPVNAEFVKDTVTINGLNASFTIQHYTDSACTVKANVVDGPFTSSLVVGSAVTASLGGTSVTAYPVDWHGANSAAFEVFYDLMYVDTAATPNRYYEGARSAYDDGRTAAKRPTTLYASSYFVKQ